MTGQTHFRRQVFNTAEVGSVALDILHINSVNISILSDKTIHSNYFRIKIQNYWVGAGYIGS